MSRFHQGHSIIRVDTLAKRARQPDLTVLDLKVPAANGNQGRQRGFGCETQNFNFDVHIIRTPTLEAGAKLVGIRQVIAKEYGLQSLLSAIEDELSDKNSPS